MIFSGLFLSKAEDQATLWLPETKKKSFSLPVGRADTQAPAEHRHLIKPCKAFEFS